MLREKHLISIVVPVFNEQETIEETLNRLVALRSDMAEDAEVEMVVVDDGSEDMSLALLRERAREYKFLKVISLSRNFGHQVAITAGIDVAKGDFVAVIDADLQDPPELIADMYRMALDGFDIVYGRRRSRGGESVYKRASSAVFYRLLRYLCDLDIPVDTGDFRLMSRRAVNAFNQLRERHRFVRGMVPWLGFKSVALEYHRNARFAGTTKYPMRKMVALATNAILSFSSKPLTLAVRLGLFAICIGLLGGIYILYLKLVLGTPAPGLTTILLCSTFFSGIQICLIGVVGEYIARIYEEAKGRPLYLIAEAINV